MSQTISLDFDTKTLKAIDDLKAHLKARDIADVIQMSLALTQRAVANTNADNVITLAKDGDGEKIKLER